MKTTGQLLRDYLAKAHRLMRRNEQGVLRETGTKAVHDMRVGSRRMRSALRLLDRIHPLPGRRGLATDLKWLFRGLGEVHDLALHLKALAEETRQAADAADLAAFVSSVEKDYRTAQTRLRLMLGSGRYRRLLAVSRQAAIASPVRLAPEQPKGSAETEACKAIRPWVKKCRVRAKALKAGSPDRACHRFRIQCKRTRYGLECLEGALPRPLARLIPDLEKLQSLLGRHQDQATRLRALGAFLETPAGHEQGPRRAALALQARRLKAHRKNRAKIVKAVARFAASRALARALKAAE